MQLTIKQRVNEHDLNSFAERESEVAARMSPFIDSCGHMLHFPNAQECANVDFAALDPPERVHINKKAVHRVHIQLIRTHSHTIWPKARQGVYFLGGGGAGEMTADDRISPQGD